MDAEIEVIKKSLTYLLRRLISTVQRIIGCSLQGRSCVGTLWQIACYAFLIVGFLCFAYSWFFLLKTWSDNSFRWRNRLSLFALSIASGAVLLRFVMPTFWGADFGTQVHTAQEWTKASVRGCAVGLLLALAGRPRLIVPVVVVCLATSMFWVLSTIP